jgi:hypothetical protein
MPINATVTGYNGPGKTLTAAVFTGADVMTIDANGRTLVLHWNSGAPDTCIDIQAAATYTLTLASGVFTLTIA